MQADPIRRGHDLHRFLTFVDACIAIAVTLLVLPLIEAAGDVDKGVPLSTFLDHHQNQFWSFLLSFAVIATIWTGHHTYLTLVRAADNALVNWILAWALCLVVLPVPTALISRYDSGSGVVPLYIGLLLVSSLCSAGVAVHVWRTPALWAEGVTASDVAPVSQIVMTGCYLAALLLGSLVDAVNFYALLFLVLAGPLTNAWRRRLKSGSSGGSAATPLT